MGMLINEAMNEIEEKNTDVKGALPKSFTRLSTDNIFALLKALDSISFDIELTEDEKERIKAIVKKLLATLKRDKLRHGWNTKQAVGAQVRNMIKASLREMPGPYLQVLDTLGGKIYEHIASTYDGMGQSIYDDAG